MPQELILSLDKTQYSAPIVVSKQGATQTAINLYQKIMDGETSAISVVEAFKFMEDIFKEFKSCTDENGKNTIPSLVRDEITRNSNDGKKYASKNGTEFSLFEAGTKYDFSACGDPIWNDMQDRLEELKDAIKDREDYLKTIKKPTKVLISEEDGEVVELFPCIKTSTSTYKVELIKD